jgi:uncharacterized protein (DUF1501 family)
MAELYNETLAAYATSDPITVDDNTVIGITSTALVKVYDQSGAYLGEVLQNGAANIIAVSNGIYIIADAAPADVIVHGNE